MCSFIGIHQIFVHVHDQERKKQAPAGYDVYFLFTCAIQDSYDTEHISEHLHVDSAKIVAL